MAQQTLSLLPDTNSYAISVASDDTVEIILDGGTSRRRADKDFATRTIAVQWTTNKIGYNYLQAFYRTATVKGSMPFTANLINDTADADNYTCWFVDKTFLLASISGLTYVVTASLEVVPQPIDAIIDQLTIDLFNAYGNYTATVFTRLAYLANDAFPKA